ncbi:MAG TPA: hypothetical protein EYG30_06255 [Planctomycetes bacterium]|jgi:hypothetical protein|nr:hypothetical protein [Planctomycetota bacterium]HIL51837.1 hypothetical protein [Planctomycetota bacterium]
MGTSPQLLTGREIPNSDPEHGTSQRAQFPMQAIRSTILVVLFSLSAQANDWSVTATDSIQAAIQAASSGDRILIDPGTYHEVLDLQGKRLELIGLGGATTTTVNGTGLGNCVVLADGVASGTRLHGLTLTGGAGRPFPSSFGFDYYGGAVWAGGGAQLEISDCILSNNAWGTGTFAGGIYSGGARTHVAVRRTRISNNRAWASGGATLCDYSATMLLEQCTVYGNSSDNFFGHQGGISMANAGQVWVTHSVVWGNEGNQIGAFGPPYNQGTAALVDYCTVQGGYSGAGNLIGDPLFANPAAGDFALLSGSPCIDAGDGAFPLDCDGTLADLGASLPVCPDCNGNGLGDDLDIVNGSPDCDANSIPDECDPDTNTNGIPDACECLVEYFCSANVNSSGVAASIGAAGLPSVSQNTFTISAAGLAPGQPGVFYFGFAKHDPPLVFGEGLRCVAGAIQRLDPALQIPASAMVSLPFDFSQAAAFPFTQGQTAFFQFWYRDPDPSGSGWNLTDGLSVTFCP